MWNFFSKLKLQVSETASLSSPNKEKSPKKPTKIPQIWNNTSHDSNKLLGLKSRLYTSYEQYVDHQRQKILKKLRNPELFSRINANLKKELMRRLPALFPSYLQKKVLCLGARGGGEVQAFLELGAFAVGVDLNPGPSNHYVVTGDFHALQFANKSVDIMYCNCMDHVFNIDKVINEIRRVLLRPGFLILDVVNGSDQRRELGYYESFWWSTISDLLKVYADNGFVIEKRLPIEVPFAGECVLLKLE